MKKQSNWNNKIEISILAWNLSRLYIYTYAYVPVCVDCVCSFNHMLQLTIETILMCKQRIHLCMSLRNTRDRGLFKKMNSVDWSSCAGRKMVSRLFFSIQQNLLWMHLRQKGVFNPFEWQLNSRFLEINYI